MNNLEEKIQAIEKELEQLKQELKKEQDTVGYSDDEIFLLSAEEYKVYKDDIPEFNCYWWLRSSSTNQYNAAVVSDVCSVDFDGYKVSYVDIAVRPALKLSNEESQNLEIEERFIKYDFPWIYLGDNISIAEVPVAFYRFDEESNDYEKSEIRQFLLDWLKARK